MQPPVGPESLETIEEWHQLIEVPAGISRDRRPVAGDPSLLQADCRALSQAPGRATAVTVTAQARRRAMGPGTAAAARAAPEGRP
jgi:hypothetical protein